MSQDEFTKLFTFVSKKLDTIEHKLDTTVTKTDIETILRRLDSIEKQLEITEDERLVMGHQLDMVNRWVNEVVDKIGHKLTV
jgi:tetrahydromethanopterin S-methyltransferase subunit G